MTGVLGRPQPGETNVDLFQPDEVEDLALD